MCDLKGVNDSLPSCLAELIANNQVTSPLIKWCSSFCLFQSVHLHPQLLSSLLDEILMLVISDNLWSPFFFCLSQCLFVWPAFWTNPTGRALQMHDDPVISVCARMLRKTFSAEHISHIFFGTLSSVPSVRCSAALVSGPCQLRQL